jgi:hypothetical protein
LKFKFIFVIFTVLLLLFLAALVLLPNYLLGSSLSLSFWRLNWPLILAWFLIYSSFNIFYFTNRQLFLLLEKEDWPALVRYLEEKVMQKGKYSSRFVRLLANSYLVLSDSNGVISLENKLAAAKPALLNTHALIFGTARILGNDIPGAVSFFDSCKTRVKPGYKEWVQWYYGFALLLDRRFEKSADEFSLLARESRDGVITALSAYFISENLTPMMPDKRSELKEISSTGRERVLKAMPKIEAWKREAGRLSTEIHAAAISKYIEEACLWVYK